MGENGLEDQFEKPDMPIIDVSQNSYRSLVKAAHERGMSIDRFIQAHFSTDSVLNDAPSKSEFESKSVPQSNLVDFPLVTDRIEANTEPPETQRALRTLKPTLVPASGFERLWKNVEHHAGTEFSTKRGNDFTYTVESGYLTVIESGARIPKSQFKKADNQWPSTGPSAMRGIYGASFVWAVLADDRIREVA